LLERPNPRPIVRIVCVCGQQRADATHPLALLRLRHERPRHRAADESDEVAPPHSITSSARASTDGGTVSPSILAVCMLMTSSNLLD